MATAVMTMYKCTSTNAGTETSCSNHPCFLNADVHSTDTASYAIRVPQAPADSDTYSYEVWISWKCTTAPDNQCTAFKFWGSSSQPDDPTNKVTMYAGTNSSGVTPVDTSSSYATSTVHGNYYSEGTALSLLIEPGDSKIDAVGEYVRYLVLQIKVEYGAAQGNLTTMVLNLSYEES